MLDGVVYPSVTNIGTRPTFESGEENVIEPTCSTWTRISTARNRDWVSSCGFVTRKSFEDVEALKAQIAADRDQAHDRSVRQGWD